MKIIKIIILLFISFFANAQVGGETVYQFLNISTSARQLALGGEVLTITDDINQPIWNPATISIDLDRKVSVNYSSFLAGINVGSISYASEVSRRFGVIHGNIKYFDYGSLIGADEQGNETGTFRANDIAVSLGYSYNIPRSNFYVGTNLKFINSNISNFSSVGVAVDLALLYTSIYKPYSFTAVVRNLGTQIKSFSGQNEDLPLEILVGGSYQLEHVPLKWYATVDNLQQWDISVANPSDQIIDLEGNITEAEVGFLGNAIRHLVIGAELFPKSVINLRLGYNFRRAAELKLQNARSFSGISFGFGIKMKRFKFNFANSRFHSATNVSTFSLEIDLDSNRF
ncbi:type IX secretion system protein PorQ [uncultured Polaribacter sp.]|uniref:type IX secretion system protein PorQ n=1 Tax=uncultured Polaribacter sp. TaxID=174711 RepID=UPI00260F2713|nr:type IX secretion system protein PorQ [uncultured Polaribacter sp.]